MRRNRSTKSFFGMTLWAFLVCLSGLSATIRSAHADEPAKAADTAATTDLPGLARQAAKQFQSITSDEVGAARTAALRELRKLETTLRRNPVQVAGGWSKFLNIRDLREKLGKADAAPDDVEAAATAFAADEPGVEWKPIQDVRRQIRTYVNLARTAADEKASDTHATELEELATALDSYAQAPTADLSQTIGRRLGRLRRTRQSSGLVDAVDARYTLPNLHLDVSHSLIAAGVNQEVDQHSTVVDNLLGTTVQSQVHLQGQVTMSFVPSDRDASLRLLLAGTAHSNSVGRKGPVTIYSTGVTNVSANKDLHFNDLGLLSDPTSADCSTSTNINSINARCNMIRKMAWRKASKMQGQAEAVAARKAEYRVQTQMDDETSDLVNKANESYRDKFRARLARRDELPRQMRFSTTSDRLNLVMLQSGDAHVAAPSPPPAVVAVRDLNVRLHQSFVGNLSEAVIGGTTLTDEKLADMIEDIAGEVPEELQISPEKEPWSITFASEHPITVSFTDQDLTITITGRRFTRGEGNSRREIRDPARIVAKYSVAKTPTGSKLSRQGDLEVEYTSIKGVQSAAQIAFKTFLRRKFESMFKPEIVSEGIQLKGRWEKAGKLAIQDIQLSPGWISLGWNLAKVDTRTAANP